MKQRPCRQCRTPFTLTNGGQRYCPTCREERKANEAAKPLRQCKVCGNLAQHLHARRYCPECFDTYANQHSQEIKQQRIMAYRAKLDARIAADRAQDDMRARYDALFDTLPVEQQALHCAVLLVSLLQALQEQAETIHPEEIPADNQPAIDAEFATIMKGITL